MRIRCVIQFVFVNTGWYFSKIFSIGRQKLPTASDIKQSISGEVILSFLALLSVGMIIFEVVVESNIVPMLYIYVIDIVISLIFLADWINRLLQAPDRGKFLRQSWWELLAAVPVYLEPTGILRFVRLIVRLRILFNKSRYFVKHAYPLEIFTFFAVIMFGGADLFHAFEYGVNENVQSFFDSIWWAMVTITTVGYGDIAPVTTGGRIVSMALMMLGIGFLGLTTGLVARALVAHRQ